MQLAARICAHARPDQILAAPVVVESWARERSLFSEAGSIQPKGFDRSMLVYEVNWQAR